MTHVEHVNKPSRKKIVRMTIRHVVLALLAFVFTRQSVKPVEGLIRQVSSAVICSLGYSLCVIPIRIVFISSRESSS